MSSFQGRCWPLVDLCQVVSDGKAQRFSWPIGTLHESVEMIYMKFMGLSRLKKKKTQVSHESSRFAYRVFMGPFSS